MKTNVSGDRVVKMVGPIIYMASECAESGSSLSDLVDDLCEAGLLGTGEAREVLKQRVLELGTPLEKLARDREEAASPVLPLLYIKEVATRCVLISEFEREYDVDEDKPSEYKPSLKRLYPRVTLELSFRNDAREAIGVVLTPQGLRDLVKALELAEVEMKSLSSTISKDKVVSPEV